MTGRLYNAENLAEIGKLRRNVPLPLTEIIEKLLADSVLDISKAVKALEKVSNSLFFKFKV